MSEAILRVLPVRSSPPLSGTRRDPVGIPTRSVGTIKIKGLIMNKDILELDGAIGGGQVLRTALSLSMITGTPFRIHQHSRQA